MNETLIIIQSEDYVYIMDRRFTAVIKRPPKNPKYIPGWTEDKIEKYLKTVFR